MVTVVLIVYAVLGYWAYVKVFCEGKTYIYSNPIQFYGLRIFWGILFGFILIPIAVIKLILQRLSNRD